MDKSSYVLSLAKEADTLDFGRAFSALIKAPCVVYLEGDLGAGKTTFTRGFLQGLGHEGVVKSPTYALVESYPFEKMTVHHFDLYRFADPYEWIEAGLDELVTPNSILLIEWPDKGEGVLPECDLVVSLSVQNEQRMCTIIPHTLQGKQYFSSWLTSHAEDF